MRYICVFTRADVQKYGTRYTCTHAVDADTLPCYSGAKADSKIFVQVKQGRDEDEEKLGR